MQHLFTPPLPRHKKSKPIIHCTNEHDISVSNLRKLYSSLLEEMAPKHAEQGTGSTSKKLSVSNIRWKNMGTITVMGGDDDGYDYAYTPDDYKKSWRLKKETNGVLNGVTGGDWSKDGVRRYYTGGVIARRENKHNSSETLSIGGMEVDISTMNGVEMSPNTSPIVTDTDIRNKDAHLFADVNQPVLLDEMVNEEENNLEDVHIVDSASECMEDVALESFIANAYVEDDRLHDTNCKSGLFDSERKSSFIAFESVFHISPNTAWRLHSAYAPTNKQEYDMILLGSDALSHYHPKKTEEITKVLEMAKNSESRVCDWLWRLSRVICSCERIKTKGAHGNSSAEEHDIEAADAVFAYFCEKNILPMLIDATLCRPPPLSSSVTYDLSWSPFSGSCWTAPVKSQIIQVIAMLLFNTTSQLSLTYLLSNNYMNELIMGILPLEQWKKEALEEILPPYVTLLRGLVMKLGGNEGKYYVPLLLYQRQKNGNDEVYFPLLFAAVQVLVSNLGSTLRDSDGCIIKTTAMNVVLNLCRIVNSDVRDVLVGGIDFSKDNELVTLSTVLTIEQEQLFPYICNSLKQCYDRSVRLLMATMQLQNQNINTNENREAREEAASRHKDISSSLLSELHYWLGFLDDLLSCEIRHWNARLCEYVMSEVIVGTVLLNWNQSLVVLEDGGTSLKTSEEVKAKAEIRTSVQFITLFLGMVEHRPLVKMITAALLCEKCPISWYNQDDKRCSGGESFFRVSPIIQHILEGEDAKLGEKTDVCAGVNTSMGENKYVSPDKKGRIKKASTNRSAQENTATKLNLNGLVEHDELNCDDDCTTSQAYGPNHQRKSLLNMISGKSDSVEVTSLASLLLSAVLENDAIDDITLDTLGVLHSSESSAFENAIAEFLEAHIINGNMKKMGAYSQKALTTAAKHTSSLGIMLLERAIYHNWTHDGTCLDEAPFNYCYKSSRFIQALQSSLHYVSIYCLKLSQSEQTKHLFADQIEIEIRKRYIHTESETHQEGSPRNKVFSCCLSNYNPYNFIHDSTYASISSQFYSLDDKLEALHNACDLLLHFRSLTLCIQKFHTRFTSLAGPGSIANKRWCDEGEVFSFSMIENADDDILAIGDFQVKPLPQVGKEIDLRGRTVFHGVEYKKKLSIIDASVMALIFVIDPEEIYVGRNERAGNKNKCIVDGIVPITNIIASATEKTLLHIAFRSSREDIPWSGLVKDGKLTIDFRTNCKSIAVKDCLDKHCMAFRSKKTFQIEDFLEKCSLLGLGNNESETASA